MKNEFVENMVNEIEQRLIAKKLIQPEEKTKRPTICQWCGGSSDEDGGGCSATGLSLHWRPRSKHFEGCWVSTGCAWLMESCEEAIDRDDS